MTSLAAATAGKLKCVLCKCYPNGDVYECGGRHVGCVQCVDKAAVRSCPQCSKLFDKKKRNPIEKLEKLAAKIPCEYEESGCTWVFESSKLRGHLRECKYRPYRCILKELNVMPCRWTGLQHEIEDHLEQSHPALGEPFSYFQQSKVPFFASASRRVIKLVDAFSKQFLFCYFSDVLTQTVYFCILYFGRREEARQYYYEFDIRAPAATVESKIRRIKFEVQCVADCEPFDQLLREENCVSISFRRIKHFLHGDSIPFRFIVKKLDKEGEKQTASGKKEVPVRKRSQTLSTSSDDPPLRPIPGVGGSSAFDEFPIF